MRKFKVTVSQTFRPSCTFEMTVLGHANPLTEAKKTWQKITGLQYEPIAEELDHAIILRAATIDSPDIVLELEETPE
jgi:hypothetical protein